MADSRDGVLNRACDTLLDLGGTGAREGTAIVRDGISTRGSSSVGNRDHACSPRSNSAAIAMAMTSGRSTARRVRPMVYSLQERKRPATWRPQGGVIGGGRRHPGRVSPPRLGALIDVLDRFAGSEILPAGDDDRLAGSYTGQDLHRFVQFDANTDGPALSPAVAGHPDDWTVGRALHGSWRNQDCILRCRDGDGPPRADAWRQATRRSPDTRADDVRSSVRSRDRGDFFYDRANGRTGRGVCKQLHRLAGAELADIACVDWSFQGTGRRQRL